MADRLRNKVAVITGGTSGIGEATAELFTQEGARVVICGRSKEKGKALADRLGENVRYIRADVALYLASEDGRFVNSHDLVIDGGRTSMFCEPDSA